MSPQVEMLIQDTRYALRSLRRTPAFTAAALVTLALGIGATTAILTVVNAALLQPLPYPEPDRLVQLMRRDASGTEEGQTGRRYLFFRDHLGGSLTAIAAWRHPTGVNLSLGDRAEFVDARSVSKEFLDLFGGTPMLGRNFTADEDTDGGPDAVILSHALWLRQFGGDPGAVGRSITLGGRACTVVGVLPASFVFEPSADLLVPLRPGLRGPGGGFNYTVGARLKPGVSIGQASAETASVWAALKESFPGEVMTRELPSTLGSLQEVGARAVRPALLTMAGAVLLLLLIACANVANLLLARASGRSREMAVRAALGAGRARLVRQLLTESVLLALAGAVAGLLFATWGVSALLDLAPPGLAPPQVRIDAVVLVATMVMAVGTGLLFGLAPAVSLSRHGVVDTLREEGTRATAGRRSGWLRRMLVAGEIGVCMVLLVSAGLLIQTFARLRSIDPGFDPRGILVARMSLQGERYASPERLMRLFEDGLDRLGRLPGVSSAAVVNGVPIERGLNLNVTTLDGPYEVKHALTDWRYASTGYFRTMGIAVTAGRGFDDGDRAGAPPVTVVNEEFARRFFKGTAALGRHVRVFDNDAPIEIVGIVKNVREQGLTASLPAVMFVPITQANPSVVRASHTYYPMSWVVRASDTGAATIERMREAIRDIDPQQPFSSFRTMEEVKLAQISSERFQMTLLAAFAAIGLLLATAGVYGLMAYGVAQRTRELGIRMALGATRLRIVTSVIATGASLAVTGIAAGTLGALAFTRTLRTVVWGIGTGDPRTFAGVAAVLLLVAILASLIPAIRAVRRNPVAALRE